MSGIAALVWSDGRAVRPEHLGAMASQLRDRGPEATSTWEDGRVGLVHTALRTTPEAGFESQPTVLADPPIAITADLRIDNRSELASLLGLGDRLHELADAQLVLGCYAKWGDRCAERLLGDFAFAIWDAQRQRLYCARDHFGTKPLYFHSNPGRLIAVASNPHALIALNDVPHRINEARIADFLVNELEGIDKTSTFFEEVFRLPPAHSFTWTAGPTSSGQMRQRRFWRCEPVPEIRLRSDADYVEAFLDVFEPAVACRMRNAGRTGSMLSGGIDSGTIVAVAAEIAAGSGGEPFPTFSAVAASEADCVESSAIRAAQGIDHIAPHTAGPRSWTELRAELVELTWSVAEPFDLHMTLVRAMYVLARRHSTSVVFDGLDADTLFSAGDHLTMLVRRGRFLSAGRNAVGLAAFWGDAVTARQLVASATKHAVTPPPIERAYRRWRAQRADLAVATRVDDALMTDDFAARVSLGERLDTLRAARTQPPDRALALEHPYLTVGLERYDRVASAVGVEPRHPFLDRRVVDFCLALPGEQLLDGGWPKAILRKAMDGRLPDAVRWRRGKQHLGAEFTRALHDPETLRDMIRDQRNLVDSFVDVDRCLAIADSEILLSVAGLAMWLERNSVRPDTGGHP